MLPQGLGIGLGPAVGFGDGDPGVGIGLPGVQMPEPLGNRAGGREVDQHDDRADLARFVREVYGLPATDTQLAAVEAALREAELERKRLLDAAKAAKAAEHGQAGGSGSSSSKAASRS
jgi:hypothetical protein